MATYLITHEVDDVERWASSPKRAEAFAQIGASVRPFTDPEGSNKVGLIAEIPDFDAFQEFLKGDAAADAMKSDGVRPESILVLREAG